jgi:predicted ATPase
MPTDSGGGDRQQLFDAVVTRSDAADNRRRGVAVVLDDVQWFDEASAGLLH